MLKKSIIAVGLLTASLSAQAVTYNGYTLNEETNIVSNGSLDWLQWDVTAGMSVKSALNMYGNDGWRLATYDAMVGLFNDFFAEEYGYTFVSDDNIQQAFLTYKGQEQEARFLELFSTTTRYGQANFALFEDLDQDGFYPNAHIGNFDTYGYVELSGDSGGATINFDASFVGVALIKDSEVAPVPLPAASWLFLSSLGVVAGLNRQKWKRT